MQLSTFATKSANSGLMQRSKAHSRSRWRTKFVERQPFADPDAAARRIVETANGVEAVQDGRIFIERVNEPFLGAAGRGERFRAGIERAVALGWLWRHESGTYLKITEGAALFA
jgi:hypothetical protein